MRCKWIRTNEDLHSITRCLNVKPADSVLAIGGSGDQAFAMLEYAEKVAIVDYENWHPLVLRKVA